MSTEVIPKPPTSLSPHTVAKARQIDVEGTAERTVHEYQRDLNYFWTWAKIALGLQPAYPVSVPTVITFITDHVSGLDRGIDEQLVELGVKSKLGAHSVSTVSRRISALSTIHNRKGLENPCENKAVSQLLSKARRRGVKKGKPKEKKAALTMERLNAMLATCDESLIGIRDRALLLFAFGSGGRRRSEVANAIFENLEEAGESYVYTLSSSKTDQEGKGFSVPIKGTAALALRQWLAIIQIDSGKLFRGVTKHGQVTKGITGKTVARIVKKRAELAGLDPSLFSAHSIRSGFVSTAGRNGYSLGDVMALSGHKTTAVAMNYYQAGAVLNNPAADLFS